MSEEQAELLDANAADGVSTRTLSRGLNKPDEEPAVGDADLTDIERRLEGDGSFFPFEIALARNRLGSARRYLAAGFPGAARYELRDLLRRLARVDADRDKFLVRPLQAGRRRK